MCVGLINCPDCFICRFRMNRLQIELVGELKSRLFFLLTRSGPCFGFNVGHLLWFYVAWLWPGQPAVGLTHTGSHNGFTWGWDGLEEGHSGERH